ncbi:hypothetical protein [Sorangium cellulosum]|uniref:hypothetical protein n=1 Tax=Sorangium cellulosum TaxID=56 RepID=UPI001013C03C|nr:hypothetical protein [Sorangium cellulosum]
MVGAAVLVATAGCGALSPEGGALAGDEHVASSQHALTITGSFSGTLSFGGTSLTSSGGRDIFVAKFDSAGNHVWSKSFGSASGHEDGNGVAVDSTGNVFATGGIEGAVDFGGGTLSADPRERDRPRSRHQDLGPPRACYGATPARCCA